MVKARQHVQYARNPIYIVYMLVSILIFIPLAISAAKSYVPNFEKNLFDLIYGLSPELEKFFTIITQLGSFWIIPILALFCLIRRRGDIAIRLTLAGTAAYVLAKALKLVVDRGRPEEVLGVVARESATGLGFPSGHAAIATAVGLVIAMYLPRKWAWIIFTLIGLVCVSRVYLGVHLPFDVIGGLLVGFFCYSLVNTIFGAPYNPIDPKELAKKLRHRGLEGLTLRSAAVDARGSVPFFGEYKGRPIFVKVYNRENNIADWLFKLTRRILYRRLEDEVPSLTPKRAIEHEAYETLLARHMAGARSSELIGTFHVGQNSYAMVTELIDATGMDKLPPEEITESLLMDAWRQIEKLHDSHIIHKDLRCANIMVHNKTKEAWLIDFGFSESSVEKEAYYKDTIELIASSATKIGAKRAVAAAYKALGKEKIAEALPYMQYPALSGATTHDLKKQKGLLKEIILEMQAVSGAEKRIKSAKLTRISKSNIIQITILVVFFAILILKSIV